MLVRNCRRPSVPPYTRVARIAPGAGAAASRFCPETGALSHRRPASDGKTSIGTSSREVPDPHRHSHLPVMASAFPETWIRRPYDENFYFGFDRGQPLLDVCHGPLPAPPYTRSKARKASHMGDWKNWTHLVDKMWRSFPGFNSNEYGLSAVDTLGGRRVASGLTGRRTAWTGRRLTATFY